MNQSKPAAPKPAAKPAASKPTPKKYIHGHGHAHLTVDFAAIGFEGARTRFPGAKTKCGKSFMGITVDALQNAPECPDCLGLPKADPKPADTKPEPKAKASKASKSESAA